MEMGGGCSKMLVGVWEWAVGLKTGDVVVT
jgi:hypothetical protein